MSTWCPDKNLYGTHTIDVAAILRRAGRRPLRRIKMAKATRPSQAGR